MKKYTILDSYGQKKIVYAPNMKKALRYIGDGEKTVKDSKVGDSTVSIYWSPYRQYGLDYFIKKYGLNIHTSVPYPATSPHSGIDYVAKGKKEDLITLLTKIKRTELISEIKDSVKDSKVKDEDDYFYFDADEDDKSLDDYKRIMKQCGLTITKVEGNNREAFIYYRGSSSAEQKAAKMLGISLEDSIKDSTGQKKTVKDSKFYVILSNYDYTKAQAEKDARKYGLKLQILGPANGSKQETEAYLVGPRANIIRMLKETDMDEFEGDIEDSIKDSTVKDADTNIVDKLISEEEKAVMDYKEALMTDSDLSANAVYAHILAEELEHLKELRSLREQPSLGDSIDDAEWKTYNGVHYTFERNYWRIFSIFNRIEMLDNDVHALARKLNLIVEPYDKYHFKRLNKNDKDVYYSDYKVKGKDKDNVIKFCETLNPSVKPLTFE